MALPRSENPWGEDGRSPQRNATETRVFESVAFGSGSQDLRGCYPAAAHVSGAKMYPLPLTETSTFRRVASSRNLRRRWATCISMVRVRTLEEVIPHTEQRICGRDKRRPRFSQK